MADRHQDQAPAEEEYEQEQRNDLVGEAAVDADEDGSKSNEAPLEKAQTNDSRKKGLEERSVGKIVLIMGALCMATFLAALDATIVAVALPSIAEDLAISQSAYAWVGSAYTLGAAASTPPWGKISDIFGRKPILLCANVVFFVGSLISALSVNTGMLLGGRSIQGIGAGGLLSLVNICIGDLVSLRNRGAYYGVIGGVWAIAGALGPMLGGVFTSFVTWRWCFYVNLPCDGAAFIILLLFLDIDTPKTPFWDGIKAIDWLGTVLIIGGVIMFLLGLQFGGVTQPWDSAEVLCLIILGLFVLGLFLIAELKVAKYPIMPLRLFNHRNNVFAFAVCFFHGITFIAGSYFLPLYFQSVLGATPILAGVYQLAFVGAIGIGAIAVGIYIRKTGSYRPPIWVGMLLLTLGFGLLIDLPTTADWGRIVPFEIIAGLGAGPIFQAPLIALQNNVELKDMATATATFAFVRNLATSIGLVIGTVVYQNRVNAQYDTLASVLPQNLAAYLAQQATGASVQVVDALQTGPQTVVRQVLTASLSQMWIFFACAAGVGFLMGLGITKKELSREHKMRRQGLEQEEADRQEELAKREEKRRSKNQDQV